MSRPPDPIHIPGKPFNQPGSLFDSDEVPQKVRFLTPLPQEVPTPGSSSGDLRPRVRRRFANTEQEVRDLTEEASITEITAEEPRFRALIGNFSAVRAARVAHQHYIRFWTGGVLDQVTKSQDPDLSEDRLEQMYNDFLLFSYLPPSMTPSRDEFKRMVQPGKYPTYVQNHLIDIGIAIVGPRPVPTVPTVTDVDGNDDILPTPGAFSETLSGFCKGGVFALV